MNKTEIITFEKLPASIEELKQMADLNSPFKTAALAVAVFANYEKNVDATVEMLNFLRGPRPLSQYDIQFIRDRLAGKGYVIRSYFKGTSPANDYTPSAPYQVEVSDNPYSYTNEGYATLWLKSSGADSPRQVTLRNKPSTGEWFLWEAMFLGDIRIPASQDEWA